MVQGKSPISKSRWYLNCKQFPIARENVRSSGAYLCFRDRTIAGNYSTATERNSKIGARRRGTVNLQRSWTEFFKDFRSAWTFLWSAAQPAWVRPWLDLTIKFILSFPDTLDLGGRCWGEHFRTLFAWQSDVVCHLQSVTVLSCKCRATLALLDQDQGRHILWHMLSFCPVLLMGHQVVTDPVPPPHLTYPKGYCTDLLNVLGSQKDCGLTVVPAYLSFYALCCWHPSSINTALSCLVFGGLHLISLFLLSLSPLISFWFWVVVCVSL